MPRVLSDAVNPATDARRRLALATACAPHVPQRATAFANGPPGPDSPLPLSTGPPTDAPPPSIDAVDQEVAAAVRRQLKSNKHLAAISNRVRVKVNKGVVTLTGTLPTAPDRKTIVKAISWLPGVDRVNDQLQVGPP
jgi:hypothetical protein